VNVKAILEKSTVDYVDSSRAATSSVLGAPRPGAWRGALPSWQRGSAACGTNSWDLGRGGVHEASRGSGCAIAAPR
jgi:hypothetical protein